MLIQIREVHDQEEDSLGVLYALMTAGDTLLGA